MKYIKKFNEELRSEVYKKAADRLKNIGHIRRASELEEWSKNITSRENKKKYGVYKKYGTFNMDIFKHAYLNRKSTEVKEFSGKFHIVIDFDEGQFADTYGDWKDSKNNENQSAGSFYLLFFMGIIPSDEESESLIQDTFGDYKGDGIVWINWICLQMFDKESNFNPGPITFDPFENHEAIFADRASAVKFKNLISGILEGDIVYETLPNKGENRGLKDYLVDTLCSENDIPLEDFEKIISSVKKTNINSLYKD